ncbi:hypothetical protein WICMUC_003204 [Wickerhamomyces mucosus]|uniref:Protein OCA4 n=1 Tax=Wickerhamomyces mucosus TaxID=1378264 RepID=A0A9P8TCR0_9ASCO|nr:hypothetical protein WICMUC_003204 [Wickerhamomyces mucosus]
MLLPPENFGLVEAGLFRCSKLDAINFAFLETLQLKSIVLLNNESQMMKNFRNFIKINNIKAIQFENDSIDTSIGENNSDWMVFNKEVIQKVFQAILDKNNYNLLIIDKTNVLIGLLRKVCKWNYSSLISEYRLYASKNSNYFAEAFLELATLELKTHSDNIRILKRVSTEKSLEFCEVEEPKLSNMSDVNNDEDDENGDEEDLISGSPQVPQTLLKMVEMRKKKNTKPINQSSSTLDYRFYHPERVFKGIDTIEVELPHENDLAEWFITHRTYWEKEYLEMILKLKGKDVVLNHE